MIPRWALTLAAISASCGDWGCGAAQDTGYAAVSSDCVTYSRSTAQAETCVARQQWLYCGEGGLDAPMCSVGKDAGHE